MTNVSFGSSPFFIQVQKIGNVYAEYYSTNGTNYVQCNAPITYGNGTPAQLGFCAMSDPEQTSVAEIDLFQVQSLASSYTWTGLTNSNWSLAGSDANWSGSGTVYADSSSVTFPDVGQSQHISIANGGVQPSSVTFTNNTTAYVLSGGPVNAATTLTLNGSGSVTLDNANAYSGGTTINSGRLVVSGSLVSPISVNSDGLLSGTGNLGSAPSPQAGNCQAIR